MEKVNIKQLKSLVSKYLDTKPSKKTHEKMGLMIYGSYGIGKSAVIKSMCKEKDINHFFIDLTGKESFDLNGLQIIKGDKVIFARPSEYPNENSKKKNLLVFDECTRVSDVSVHHSLMNLITTNKIGNHKMPPNTYYIMISNMGEKDGTNIEDITDEAFKSRLIPVELVPDYSEWLSHHKGEINEEYYFMVKNSINKFKNGKVTFRDLNQIYTFIEKHNTGDDIMGLELIVKAKFNKKSGAVKEVFNDYVENIEDISIDDIISYTNVIDYSSLFKNKYLAETRVSDRIEYFINDERGVELLKKNYVNILDFLSCDEKSNEKNIKMIYDYSTKNSLESISTLIKEKFPKEIWEKKIKETVPNKKEKEVNVFVHAPFKYNNDVYQLDSSMKYNTAALHKVIEDCDASLEFKYGVQRILNKN